MTIGFEREGAVATITIVGADEHNELTPELILELDARLREFNRRPELRAAVLQGSGDSHLSVGQDPRRAAASIPDAVTSGAVVGHHFEPLQQHPLSSQVAYGSLFAWRSVKPVVAAIRGDCFGFALAIVGLHTDIRIAGQSARFGFPDGVRGLSGGEALVSRLADQIPAVDLNWLVETGLPISAESARGCFLVQEVVPDEEVFPRARAVVERIAEIPGDALHKVKFSLVFLRDLDEEALSLVEPEGEG